MSLSAYLWGIRLFTLLSLFAWLGILLSVDPRLAGTAGTALFFISLFALILGCMTLLVTWVYRKAIGETSAAHHLGIAFRQAFLLALFCALIVFFQFKQILTWWDSLLLLAAVLLVEFSLRKLFQNNNDDI